MKWNVAACLLAPLVVTATSAQAATVFISQLDEHLDGVAVSSFQFGTMATPNRAWVNLDVYRRDFSGLHEIDEYTVSRAWVPGLARVDDQIVFSSGSRTTLCATVVHRRFLFIKYDTIEKTGRCTVTSRRDLRRKDDGFVVKAVPVLNVYFEVQE